MDRDGIVLVGALAVTNMILCFGCAFPLTKEFNKITSGHNRFFRYFVMFVGIYFLEGIAFTSGMCTQVFTIGLSVVWGAIFGLWLKGLMSKLNIIRQVIFVSLYGCLPTVSFALILLFFWIICGNGLLNAEQAHKFGIPDFVPWPIDTMLGFCFALAAGTIILKTGLATIIVASIVRKRGLNVQV